MRNPYDVLGVAKSATPKDIKSAFRKLAKKHHPDQNPDDPKAKDRFAEINQAYEILGDDKRRGEFDRGEIDAEGKPRFAGFERAGAGDGADPFAGFRRQGQGPGGARYEYRSSGGPGGNPFGQGGGNPFGGVDDGDASDIFSELFGQAFNRSGAGAQPQQQARGETEILMDVAIEEAATGIRKSILFPDGRKVAVQLPTFVEDGTIIRMPGHGAALPNGQRQDAVVKVKLRNNGRYRLEGRDLHEDLQVSLRDAVLGAKVPVQTLGGRVAVTVPAWSSSDKVLRIKGRGMPLKDGGHGDLYVHVRIMLPEGGDPELEKLMRQRSA
jgi:DnaJ-class molecular chaperone